MISLMSNLNSAAQNELSARSWRIRNVTVSWGSEVVVHHFFLAGQHSYQTPGRPPQLHPPVIPFPPLAHLCRFLDFFAESCGSLTHRLWPRDPYGTQKSGSGAPICGSELDVSQNYLFREKKTAKGGDIKLANFSHRLQCFARCVISPHSLHEPPFGYHTPLPLFLGRALAG